MSSTKSPYAESIVALWDRATFWFKNPDWIKEQLGDVPMPTAEEINAITTLLKQGKVQEAADLSAKMSAETKAAEDLAAGKVAEPPPPREPAVIFDELLGCILAHLGNRHDMLALLEELRAANAAAH